MTPKNPYLQFETPLVIPHRGGGGLAPENSFAAFEQANAMPTVHALELDIHMTKDGALVVSHDPDIDRQAEGTGMIRDMTLAELHRHDMGYRWTADGTTFPFRRVGEKWPTLDEMFSRYPHHILNIDIKQHEPIVVERFVRLVEQHGLLEQVVVGSFDEPTINLVRTLAPTIATCASYSEVLRFYLLEKAGLSRLWRHNCVALQVPEFEGRLRLITRSFIRNLHKHGVQLHVWTVNDSAEMRRLLDWGVDGLITDYPDRAIATITAHNAGT